MQDISKCASIVYRTGQIYFDDRLAPYHIGCGQQFFLLRIYEHPGLSQYELTSYAGYDKGTTARAVKKLEEEGFVLRKMDEHDHRLSRLYVSEKGEPLIAVIYKVIEDWHTCLTQDCDDTEKEIVGNLLRKLAYNANTEIKKHRKKDVYGTSSGT